MTVLKYWDVPSGTYKTVSGPPGPGVAGGASGQVLTKNSATDYDYGWTGPMLPLVGGTLTGALGIAPASGASQIVLSKAASGTNTSVFGRTGTANRWIMQLGNGTAEGSGAGSDFQLDRFNDAGTYIDSPIQILRSTGQVAIKGTTTNDSAAAGFVGEVMTGGSTQTLTSGSPSTIATLALTPGDWDVWAEVDFSIGTGGATSINGWINTSTAFGGTKFALNIAFPGGAGEYLPVGVTRVSIAATTNYLLCAQATFPSGTCSAVGTITARRRR